MSDAFILVRFKDGNIYKGLYNGTSDYMYPYLFTKEEINKGIEVFETVPLIESEEYQLYNKRLEWYKKDEEEVEIYIDYAWGWCWSGKANKKEKRITSDLFDYQNKDWDYIPEWVLEYFIENDLNTDDIKDRVLKEVQINETKIESSDKNPFSKRFRCRCGKVTGKISEGVICKNCHTYVRYVEEGEVVNWVTL